MSNELGKAIEQFIEAWQDPNIEPIVLYGCPTCGARFSSLKDCQEGASYEPLDPFPLEARVRDLMSGEGGKVIENKIISLVGEHKHRRLVTIKPYGSDSRSFCQIEEDYDSCSERFVLEEEWKAQQQSG